MKKLLLLLLLSTSIFAVDGAQVFKKNCTACHFGMITKAEFKKQYMNLKAPPMVMISEKLRGMISIKTENDNAQDLHRFTTISFIKEYLKHPSWEYYACDNNAYNRFGAMPAQTHLSEDESQAVAEWIYDYFEGKTIE